MSKPSHHQRPETQDDSQAPLLGQIDHHVTYHTESEQVPGHDTPVDDIEPVTIVASRMAVACLLLQHLSRYASHALMSSI